MYYVEKWCFWSQFFCFVLKNEDFQKLFRDKILFLCIILKNEVFETTHYWGLKSKFILSFLNNYW